VYDPRQSGSLWPIPHRSFPLVRAALYITGASIEFVGIVLVASPDLFPYATRISAWLTRQYRYARDLDNRVVVRLLRRRRDATIHAVTAGCVTAAGGTLTFKKTVADDASLEDKIRNPPRDDRAWTGGVRFPRHRLQKNAASRRCWSHVWGSRWRPLGV
jgi:hypothetical protein